MTFNLHLADSPPLSPEPEPPIATPPELPPPIELPPELPPPIETPPPIAQATRC